MRELKFRAWDFVEKEMVNVQALNFGNNLEFISDKPCVIDFDNDIHLLENTKIMQYVGLKDKNGQEIYEGDIISLPSFTPSVMRIRFIEGAFCLCNLKGEYVADIYYIDHGNENQALVIGNIYENPELMEVECE